MDSSPRLWCDQPAGPGAVSGPLRGEEEEDLSVSKEGPNCRRSLISIMDPIAPEEKHRQTLLFHLTGIGMDVDEEDELLS